MGLEKCDVEVPGIDAGADARGFEMGVSYVPKGDI
jgi:hypothetical protein